MTRALHGWTKNRTEQPKPGLSVLRAAWLFFQIALVLGAARAVRAEVSLPTLFSDNMVLQQGKNLTLWGMADPHERVVLIWGNKKIDGIADAQGRWRIQFGPLEAGGPFQMRVSGKNTITIHNVSVGEVWVASGQSNMEMAVGNSPKAWGGVLNADQEIATSDYPMIRVFNVAKAVAKSPQSEVKGQWVVASPQTAGDFSAVAYFFARNLQHRIGVPVGLIVSCWGGTPAEAWTDEATLDSDPQLKTIASDWEKKITDYPQDLEKFRQELDKWLKSSTQAEAVGSPVPPAPQLPPDPRVNPWRSSGLYNAMIAPLMPYSMAGVIWYQGESNSARAYQYRRLFPAMIEGWRRSWGEGDFPFLFVQLASFVQAFAPKTSWAELREAQLMTLSLRKTAMAVTVDIGDPNDIHPKNKQEVGRRLALAAEAVAYGRDVIYSGPIYDSMSIEGESIRIHFKHANGLITRGENEIKGFEIADEDRKFVKAEAQIQDDDVAVRNRRVSHPVAVRYAWQDSPECNLYNGSGLPASPFRSDDWPGVTAHAGEQ